MDNRFVYMDYNATTPLREEVKARMIEDFEIFANASSMHEAGARPRPGGEGPGPGRRPDRRRPIRGPSSSPPAARNPTIRSSTRCTTWAVAREAAARS